MEILREGHAMTLMLTGIFCITQNEGVLLKLKNDTNQNKRKKSRNWNLTKSTIHF